MAKKEKKLSIKKVKFFKIANRKGYGAVYQKHLTEGRTKIQAFDRMVKAVKRKKKK
ncbi:MAG: hypothetical protein KKB81_03190 [Candidatus Margulisbacteria bacterium]|nr:hypothetical protein [Candidatus Margulisiibacteriota bacterium]MBU1022250.1 hypothetical protein [Candidatus Margulisiibacteriota bacterium]MBU1729311.1 hypothetical protein [Candidatus Margulisiibacteriota bacterium]MBU1955584.1 hypothetical protein [Candidatus Margulisiibacteriota bacterium]